MSLAKLTMIGMQQYFLNQGENRTLFDLLSLPETLNKDTLVENILLQGGDFETLYGDPEFMRSAIGSWSNKWQRTFIKWTDALAIEYAPLENYDRTESWDDTLARGMKTSARKDSGNTRTFNNQDKRTLDTADTVTYDSSDTLTHDTTDTLTRDRTDTLTRDRTDELTHDTTQTLEEEVSAFDASTYQPSRKDTTTLTGTDTTTYTGTDTTTYTGTDTTTLTGTDTNARSGDDTTTHTGTDTVDYSGTIKDEYGEGTSGSEAENSKNVHSGRIHGNIGVTTSQQMLQSELDIALWNIYEHITDLFLEELTIMVYE